MMHTRRTLFTVLFIKLARQRAGGTSIYGALYFQGFGGIDIHPGAFPRPENFRQSYKTFAGMNAFG
jgi:hypothetical protein